MAKTQTAQVETATKKTVPYMPYRTFSNLIAGWQVHLHTRVDRSVLATYAGGMQGLILATLRFFGLIHEDGTPTAPLKDLVESEGAERQKMLRVVLKTGYPFLFEPGFDITKATPAMFRERFEQAGATSATLNKCLSFFTAMAKDAGIPLTPMLRTRQRRVITIKRSPKPTTPVVITPNPTDTSQHQQATVPTGYERLPIPGLAAAFIQYPSDISDAHCDLFEAMVGVLRTHAKARAITKENKP